MDQIKKLAALRALELHNGDIERAAAYLGICKVTMKRYKDLLEYKNVSST